MRGLPGEIICRWRAAAPSIALPSVLGLMALAGAVLPLVAPLGTMRPASGSTVTEPQPPPTASPTATATTIPTFTPTPDALWLLVVDLAPPAPTATTLPLNPTPTAPASRAIAQPAPEVAVATPVRAAGAPPAEAAALSALESDLLAAMNAARIEAGLPPLRANARLTEVARSRSADMATRRYFSHTTPEGRNVFDMLDERGILYGWAGENLAFNNFDDANSAMVAADDLMASPPHRANILRESFTDVGIGCVATADGVKYFTVVFLGP